MVPGKVLRITLNFKQEDAKPYHARAFPVPRFHDQTFRETVDMYVRQGILRKINVSQWAAPSYIIPKKNGQATSKAQVMSKYITVVYLH